MRTKNNHALIAGTVTSAPTAYMCCGERFWSFELTVMRQSGTADTLEVNCPQLVLDTVETGDKLCLEGQVRSYAKTVDGKSRLSVALFALKAQEYKADCNEVELEGYLCEKPEFRTTPRGRDICYAMLAVNRERGKSDYIPQVFWGRTAKRVSEMQVGTQISLSGRLQSRSYTKKNATRTVFEVSVGKVSEGGSNDA